MQMKLVITTLNMDLNSPLMLNVDVSDSELEVLTRRVNRSATLDTGSVIDDHGFSQGDRDLVFRISDASESDVTKLKYFLQRYSELRISFNEGIFLVNFNKMDNDFGDVVLTFFVTKT